MPGTGNKGGRSPLIAVQVGGSDGTNLQALSTTAAGAVNVGGLPVGTTSAALGSANAPAAGAAVATLAAPGAGNYSISVAAFVGAGAAAAETNNMQLKIGATVVATLPIPPSANGPVVPVTFPRVAVPAATAITVNAVGAATATVFYTALIVATPVN